MKRPITILLFAALLLIVAPMTVADDELSPEATDAPSAKTGQICLQMTQTGAFLVAVERPVTYRYGIVLPEYPADLPTMLEKAKAGAMNDGSGYWLDGMRLQAGPLVYESSLMIPLKTYLDALPCGAAWDDGGVSLQNRDGTVLYRIELRETPIRFSLPKDRVKESAALIQRDGTWYIDFWTFQTLLRDLSIGYETVIDTEQGIFQIRLTDLAERYLLSSINGLA